MTSRSSFCDLLRENFKRRIWSFAITMLFFLFYFPISSMLTADGYLAGIETMTELELARTKMYIFNAFKSQHGQSGGIVFFLMVFAILMAASAFGYLHDRNKTDFYHSLPISRMKLYMANIINSFVITLVPYLVMALISAGITGVRTGYGECIPYALTNFLINSGFFVLLFSVSVIAMLLTGHRIVGILGTLVLYFWGAFIMSLFTYDLMSSFFNTFYSEPGRLSFLQQFVSPVYWCVSYTQSYDAGFRSAVALLAGIVFILVGSKIYSIRRSEAAGQAMAFKHVEAPVKFILVIPVAIFSGMIFQSMIGGSDFWAIFGIVAGALLSHCVIEIIYNLDFKKLFEHRAHMLAALIVSLGLFSVYRFDLFGYDSYLPDEDKVESAGIYSYALDQIYATTNDIEYEDNDLTVTLNENYISDKDVVDRMKLTSLEDVYGLAEHGIAEAGISQEPDGPDCYPRNVLLAWHLKNGKTVYRQYYLNFRTAHDELSAIHDSIEYKEAIYPVLNLSETDISDIIGVNYQDALGYHHIFFNDDKDEELKADIEKLYNTYTGELKGLTADTRRKENPVCTLQFKSTYFQNIADSIKHDSEYSYYLDRLNAIGQYPVYPSFTKTLDLLKEYGVKLNNDINADDISAIVVSSYSGTTELSGDGLSTEYVYEEPKANLVISDKDKIQEVLDSSSYYLSCGYNELSPRIYSFDMTAHTTMDFYIEAENADKRDFATIYVLDDEEGEAAPAESSEAESDVSLEENGLAAEPVNVSNEEAAVFAYATADAAYGMGSDSSYRTLNLYLTYDNVPDFIKEYYEISDEYLENTYLSSTW